ncbi:hypothetical protein [Halalkalibacter urbisdiaboli]|nr:hypothetical protein [Halalkalibacter urbisdiaboli]
MYIALNVRKGMCGVATCLTMSIFLIVRRVANGTIAGTSGF